MEHLIKLLEIKQKAIAEWNKVQKSYSRDWKTSSYERKCKEHEEQIAEIDQAIEEAKKQSSDLQMYKDNIVELHSELLEMGTKQGELENEIECRNARIEMLEERNKETNHKLIEATQLIEILEKENKDLKGETND